MIRGRQRGGSNLGCIVGLLIVGLAVVIALRVIPRRVAVAEMEDTIISTAERGSIMTDEKIEQEIMVKAKSLKLPITPETLKIKRSGQEIHIETETYTVPLDLVVTTYEWKVKHDVTRALF